MERPNVTRLAAASLEPAGLYPVWRRCSWSLGRRLANSAYVLLCLAVVLQLGYWNLLGLRMLG